MPTVPGTLGTVLVDYESLKMHMTYSVWHAIEYETNKISINNTYSGTTLNTLKGKKE